MALYIICLDSTIYVCNIKTEWIIINASKETDPFGFEYKLLFGEEEVKNK